MAYYGNQGYPGYAAYPAATYPTPVVYQQPPPPQPLRRYDTRRPRNERSRPSMLLGRQLCCGLSLVVWLIGVILLVVGFATSYWLSYTGTTKGHMGLWKACQTTTDICETLDFGDLEGFQKTVAGLMIGALVSAFIAMVTHIWLPVATAFLTLAGLLSVSAVAVYGVEYDDGNESAILSFDLSWSFALAVSGSVVLLLNAIALGIWTGLDGCRMKPTMFRKFLRRSPNYQREMRYDDRVRDWQKRSFTATSANSFQPRRSARRPNYGRPNPYTYM